MKKSGKLIATVLALCFVLSSFMVANATSASESSYNKALSATIRSDAWIQSISDWKGMGDFQVTAAYSSTNSKFARPEWIKTSWDFYAIGVGAGVSYNGISGSVSGSGYTSTSSGYWMNSNGAKTAWWRGRVGGTGLAIYVGVYNTASAFKAGVALSTTAKV